MFFCFVSESNESKVCPMLKSFCVMPSIALVFFTVKLNQ